MKYLSTRDKSLKFGFKDIFLRGLAPGGGLFLPAEIKKYNQEQLNNLSQRLKTFEKSVQNRKFQTQFRHLFLYEKPVLTTIL